MAWADEPGALSDLREPGLIEQIAEVVSFLSRRGYYDEDAPGR